MKNKFAKKILTLSLTTLSLMSVVAIAIMSAPSAEHLRGDLSVISTM